MREPAKSMIAPGILIGLLVLWPASSPAQQVGDASFRKDYLRRYAELKDVAPDMVVMEMRDRVELIATRGSQVGAASNDRRIEGFEATLLRGLQNAVCGKAALGPARPSPVLIASIKSAVAAQHLKTRPSDIAELAAQAQRLLDSQPRKHWCELASLGDIR